MQNIRDEKLELFLAIFKPFYGLSPATSAVQKNAAALLFVKFQKCFVVYKTSPDFPSA